jgi:hypothetical protein
MSKPNARFWVVVNGDYVKLTLSPGAELVHSSGGPTEEGWRRETEWWGYDADEARIEHAYWTRERDCDGLFESSGESSCPLAESAMVPGYDDLAVLLPHWQNCESRQRDYQAEAAGY